MPTYDFRNKDTGEVFSKFMKIAEKEQYLTDNPNVEQAWITAPVVAGSDRMTLKQSAGFKEVLQKIHEKTPGSQLNKTSNI